MADRKNFWLRPHLLKTARKLKSILPKFHYIYLCTFSVPIIINSACYKLGYNNSGKLLALRVLDPITESVLCLL